MGKLDLSQDTNQHLEKTIKNLNKNLKLLQNGSGEVSKPVKKKITRKTETPAPSPRPTPPPLKNEHIEKDKLILALKDQNKILLNRIEEQQDFIKKLQFEVATKTDSSTSNSRNNNHNNNPSSTNSNENINLQHNLNLSDSRILFNPVTSLPPINTLPSSSRSQQNSRSGRANNNSGFLTPRTSRTDISRRTRRKEI